MDFRFDITLFVHVAESAYNEFLAQTVPEMQRCDLAQSILQLKALGVENILTFHFPSVCSTSIFHKWFINLYIQ